MMFQVNRRRRLSGNNICLATYAWVTIISPNQSLFYDQVMPLLGVSRQDTGDTSAGYGNQENIGSAAPGLRDVLRNFFAACFQDPAGNKLVVVCYAEEDA